MQALDSVVSPRKEPLQRTLRYLGASSAWSIGLFLFSFYILVTISFLTDAVRVQQFESLWFLVSGAGFVPPLVIGLTYKFLYLDRRPEKRRVLLNLFVAGCAGASRNLSVGYFALISGLEESNLWLFRFVGGFVIGMALYFVWALSSGSKIDYLSSLRQLAETQSSLAKTRLQIPDKLLVTNERLQDRTRQAVLPQIAAIRELLGDTANVGRALDKLRDTITQQIRPMMTKLASEQPKPFEVRNLRALRKVETSLPDRFTLRDKIQVTWSSILELFGIVFWLVVFQSKNGLLDSAALFAIYFTILSIFKLSLPKKKKFKRTTALFITALVSLAASTANVMYIYFFLAFDFSELLMLSGFAILGGLIGPLVFLQTNARISKRLEIEQDIRADLLELAKENSLFAQRLWVFRKRWLLVLHGSVQSSLTAALTRLQGDKNVDSVTIELVKQDLMRAESAVQANLKDELDLDAGLKGLQDVWSGICNVSISLSERARRALDRSFDSAFCVNEIIKEAVSNAVRHGEATEAKVSIDRIEDDLLRIEVNNNGSAPRFGNEKGIGSEMMDEICLTWSLTGENKDVLLVADLPVKL
jgi:hypothetical protein